jgi:hypothetical protein
MNVSMKEKWNGSCEMSSKCVNGRKKKLQVQWLCYFELHDEELNIVAYLTFILRGLEHNECISNSCFQVILSACWSNWLGLCEESN